MSNRHLYIGHIRTLETVLAGGFDFDANGRLITGDWNLETLIHTAVMHGHLAYLPEHDGYAIPLIGHQEEPEHTITFCLYFNSFMEVQLYHIRPMSFWHNAAEKHVIPIADYACNFVNGLDPEDIYPQWGQLSDHFRVECLVATVQTYVGDIGIVLSEGAQPITEGGEVDGDGNIIARTIGEAKEWVQLQFPDESCLTVTPHEAIPDTQDLARYSRITLADPTLAVLQAMQDGSYFTFGNTTVN